MSPLAIALRDSATAVARVANGTSLAAEFERFADEGAMTPRATLIDLTHGTLRRYGRVQAIVRELSHRGGGDVTVEALLWCSLYALESRRYADYTVVDQAVRACSALERWSAKGYVNALLRGYLRERASLEARIQADPEARYQHPQWWMELVRQAYPAQWSAVLTAGNMHPPMCLRVNRRRSSVVEYERQLKDAGMVSLHVEDQGLLLERPIPVERLPGFASGEVSVQDAGAQRAARCLDLAAGQRVLDACAAPGGKAGHIAETADVELTALDANAERCARLERNLARLGLVAHVANADCTRPTEWWNGVPFDRVLADVPCSGSGVVRRHPDIKWLRRSGDVEQFAARQASMLDALWQVLRLDGKLLYATCSVFPQENDAVIDAFIARQRAAGTRAIRVPLPDGGASQGLPDAARDGFYYALIQKQA
ncbi:MAG TPA: 16S rRNA (cytosine(967)-C(5))-methyltransferase RsmB [Burkholderiales bacterium]|nr:16S rRNA (cytosine(967)-C(5))-methyltransferase RsmB [Burkholderiales bacterium]